MMIAQSPVPISPRHPRWEEFLDRLRGPEGCNFQTTWTCCGGTDKRYSRKILADMGLSPRAIEASLAAFEDHGGYCDCEVVLNLGSESS